MSVAKILGELIRLHNEGEKIRPILESQKDDTLSALHMVLAGIDSGGVERDPGSRKGNIASIIEILDNFSLESGAKIGGVEAFFHDSTAEGARGATQVNAGIFSGAGERSDNRGEQQILLRTQRHFVTPYGLLRVGGRVPATPANQRKIFAHVLELLKEPDKYIDLPDGSSRRIGDVFIFGQRQRKGPRKTPVAPPTLHLDPATEDYLYEAAGLFEKLPGDKEHWLSPSKACEFLGIEAKKKTIDALREVLLHQLSEEGDRVIKDCGRIDDCIGLYSTCGPKGITVYADPAYLKANEKQLIDRARRIANPDYFMTSAIDLAKTIKMSGHRQTGALTQVLETIRQQKGDQILSLEADDVTPAASLCVNEAIRPVESHGRTLLQIDCRAVPLLQNEIVERLTRLTQPDYFMVSVTKLAGELGISSKEIQNLMAALTAIRNERGTEQIALLPDIYSDATHMLVNQAIRPVEVHGQTFMQIDRRAIPAFAQEIKKRHEALRYPDKDWLPPTQVFGEVRSQLSQKVQRNDMNHLLRDVLKIDGERSIMVGETAMQIRNVMKSVGAAKGPSVKVMPAAIPALIPYIDAAVERRKQRSSEID